MVLWGEDEAVVAFDYTSQVSGDALSGTCLSHEAVFVADNVSETFNTFY